MRFHHVTLENGLEVVGEINPAAQSAAIGFFVQTGSRDETPELSGVSHFLEHMAFKGNDEYSAEDVNRIFDEMGASSNASTSEETTIYYAAILPEFLDQTMSLLAAMMRPGLKDEDFQVEKNVILEEIGMYDDMPGFRVYEQAMRRHFSGHPLSQCVLGTPASITALTSEQMRTYHSQRYGAGNLVLAVTGNVDWDHFRTLAERYCGNWERGTPGRIRPNLETTPSQEFLIEKEMHQEHLMQMGNAPAGNSSLRFAAEVAAMIMGEDGSGRLHWELVEPGLAESCDLSYSDFDGTGAWVLYLCCQPEETESNLDRIRELFETFNETGPTAEELEQARNKIASRIVLGSERPMVRLTTLGENWMSRREYRSVEQDLNSFRSLTLDDLRQLLKQYPLVPLTTVGLGPYQASSN